MTRYEIACAVVGGAVMFRLGYLVRLIGWRGIVHEIRSIGSEAMQR